MPREIQDMIWDLSLPQWIAPACLPSKSAPCTSIAPIADVCRRAEARAYNRQPGWINISLFDQLDNDGNLCEDPGPKKLTSIWFNDRRDLVYLEQGACFHALGESFNGNELLQKVVTDPSIALVIETQISLSLCNELEMAWDQLPEGQTDNPDTVIVFAVKPAGQVLYEAIKMRHHIYLELFHIEVYLTGQHREDVVHAGMFGQTGEEPAVIDAANFDEIRKYVQLLGNENIKVEEGRYTSVPVRLANFSREHRWNQETLGTAAPREFFMNLMDVVLNYAGHGTLKPLPKVAITQEQDNAQGKDDTHEGHSTQEDDEIQEQADIQREGDTHQDKWEVEELIDEDGNLVKERPLVKELDLFLPDWTPVVVFELVPEDVALQHFEDVDILKMRAKAEAAPCL